MKIDDLFSQRPTSKRSRITQTITNDRDEFDDLFEGNSSIKRRRTNDKQSIDIFDFNSPPSTSRTGSLKKKRSSIIDDDENKAIDDLFNNNDTRKKLRRQIKHEDSNDLLDMFKTRINTNNPQTITTIDDFKTPAITQKKIKMFFDDTDLISSRDETDTVKLIIYLINKSKFILERLYSYQTCINNQWTMVIKTS